MSRGADSSPGFLQGDSPHVFRQQVRAAQGAQGLPVGSQGPRGPAVHSIQLGHHSEGMSVCSLRPGSFQLAWI